MATIQDTIAALSAMQKRIAQGADTVAQASAEVMLDAKQAEIDKTYERPIPTNAAYRGREAKGTAKPRASSAGSKPAWKRSGALKSDQAIVVTGPGKREVRNVGASAAYEGSLANLRPGADGVNRSNDAASNAQRIGEKRLPSIVADELTKAVQG